MHLLDPSPKWLPYFGNQRRFVPFVSELLEGLGAKHGDVFFETNAGSHAIGYHMALKFGLTCIENDLGYYSFNIGRALAGDNDARRIAATGAAIVQNFGFTPPPGLVLHAGADQKWLNFLNRLRIPETPYTTIRGDLFKNLTRYSGKFIYCDFAWPWRDGSYTEEYEVTADRLGEMLGDTEPPTFKMATGRRILQDVIDFLDIATHKYEFVILSNQSSNYPPPEVLEAHMVACGYKPIVSRRLTVKAEEVDNLGKDEMFTEFQYVFEGTR